MLLQGVAGGSPDGGYGLARVREEAVQESQKADCPPAFYSCPAGGRGKAGRGDFFGGRGGLDDRKGVRPKYSGR